MELGELFGGSFVNWEGVTDSWAKRTMSSRLLLFAARHYLQGSNAPEDAARVDLMQAARLPDEIKQAFAAPPSPDAAASESWGEFVDAAVAAELEMVSYGERPPLLNELRAGLKQAAAEAEETSDLGRWFIARHDALPGADLPENPGYLPV